MLTSKLYGNFSAKLFFARFEACNRSQKKINGSQKTQRIESSADPRGYIGKGLDAKNCYCDLTDHHHQTFNHN